MKFIIYKITNIVNGKIYVGKHQTENLDDGYLGSGKLLQRALRRYGREKFIKEILHVYETEQEMNDREKELVTEEFCLRKDTYNLCEGGKGGWSYVNQTGLNRSGDRSSSDAALREHNNKMRGKPSTRPHEFFLRMSKLAWEANPTPRFLGKKHSPETIARMCLSHKGQQVASKNSQFGSMWITNDIQNQKVKKDSPIPTGWRKGRIC